MKAEQQQQLGELARTLVHPERYGDVALQDTIEFDSREVALACIEADIQEGVVVEIARIREQREMRQPPYFGD